MHSLAEQDIEDILVKHEKYIHFLFIEASSLIGWLKI